MKVLFAIAAVLVLAYSPGAGAQTLLDGFAAPGEAPINGALVDGTRGSLTQDEIALAGIQDSPSPAIGPLLLGPHDCRYGECETRCTPYRPQWYVQAGSILLMRDNSIRSRPLEWGSPAPNAGSIDFDLGAGPLVTIGLSFSPNVSGEVVYFGVFGMHGTANTTDPRLPDRISSIKGRWYDFYGWRSDWKTTYTSDLNNTELNCVRNWGQFSLLGGFRYVRFSESYYMESDQPSPFNYISPNQDEVQTSNDLWGGQLGIRWHQQRWRFFFTCTGKAGIFANQTSRNVTIESSEYPDMFWSDTLYGTVPAFVGDLNFSGGFHLTDTWSIVAGYNLMWIDQVALAAGQRVDYAYDTLLSDGSVFLHGVNVGFEGQW